MGYLNIHENAKRSLAAQNEVSFHCLIQLVSTWLSLPKIQRGQVIVITSTNRNTFQKPKPGIPLHEFTSFQEIIQEENQEKCGYLFLEDFSVHDQKEIVSYLGTNLLTKSSIVIFTILPYETIVCRWKIKAQGIIYGNKFEQEKTPWRFGHLPQSDKLLMKRLEEFTQEFKELGMSPKLIEVLINMPLVDRDAFGASLNYIETLHTKSKNIYNKQRKNVKKNRSDKREHNILKDDTPRIHQCFLNSLQILHPSAR